ncbi:anthranilate synthase component 1 [Psychrosphaera haliotis]|uniref:anthranilate synthase component 1 n=1 Tax=Psychrosphaera haliotis TaxID=555083 RepID=UPI0031D41807
MLFSQIKTELGEATSICMPCDYIASPTQAFETLTDNSDYSLLLESAEIDSKDNLKSLMLIDAAVVFECFGNKVVATAKSENGDAVLDYLVEIFTDKSLPISSHCDIRRGVLKIEFSFLGVQPDIDESTRLKQFNAFQVLRSVIQDIKHNSDDVFSVFLGGVFAYDMIANFETLPDVPLGTNTCPDYSFYLAETMLVIDHQKRSTDLIGNVFSGEKVYQTCFAIGKRLEMLKKSINNLQNKTSVVTTFSNIDFSLAIPNISDSDFKSTVTNLKENIIQGDVFQVVPSRGFALDCKSAINAYKQLKADNPSPYMFYLKHPEFELFGASPESALKYDATSKQVEVYPIAGTRIRGFRNDGSIDQDLDSRIELDLRNDKKEVSEHIMLVDLARNDVARISKTGSRYVKDFLKVDRYSYVMHLVSRVIGELEDDLDALHAYQACMNMGTLVGAPKIKASQLIRDVEKERRGSYGGAVGYLNGRGDMDTCIVIRSAFVKNGQAYVQAGAGVVFDSDPDSEVEETSNKARAVIKAVLNANQQELEGNA